MKTLFTSESVTEGHPDKVCDQIADAVLDAILAKDPTARVACECCATTGLVLVMGEISTSSYISIADIARQKIRASPHADVIRRGHIGQAVGIEPRKDLAPPLRDGLVRPRRPSLQHATEKHAEQDSLPHRFSPDTSICREHRF